MEGKNKKIVKRVLLGAVILGMGGFWLSSGVATAATGINRQINFQGKVTNTNGTNVTNGSYTFLFCLYTTGSPATACTSGADNDAVWRESKSITVTDGIFQTDLGDTTTFPGSVDFNTDNIYLGINFNANGQMTPLVRFTAAPYAMNADKVHGLTVTDTTGTLTVANGKTVSFADAFSTSGAYATTLTVSGVTNATLPSGTITLADLATAQSLTNKTIGSTGLVFSGATTDITTASGEDLTLTAAGAGIISLSDSVSITGTSLTATSATTVTLGSTGTDTITIGNAGADTITIGNAASTGVSITDNNWSVTSAGVATFITGTVIGSQTFTTNNIADSGALTIASGTASALTINSGTTGTINIGTDASAETINIGNTGAAAKIIAIGNNSQANTITIGDASATTVSITDNNWSVTAAGAASFASATVAGTLAANGGITFDAATDTVGAHTLSGTLDANTNILTNIGNAGTDFIASTGALTLAGVLTANGGISLSASQSLTAASASFVDLALVTHGTTANQGLRLPNAASASPSSPISGEGYLAWDAAGNQLIVYNGTSWGTLSGGGMSIGGSITSATQGSILFAGSSGVLAQNNAQFFWDNTNYRLGLGDATPTNQLDLLSSAAAHNGIILTNTNAGNYNPIMQFELTENTPLFTLGVDDSDGDKFKIATGSDISGTSQFTIDSTGATTIANLNLGSMSFDTNAGIVSWMDMPVTSSATIGTVESYSAQIDGNVLLTVYAESDGAEGIQDRRVQVGSGAGDDTTTALFALDIKTSASGSDDPAGFEGAMYYNDNSNTFRCYQNTGWTNCIGSGGSTTWDTIGDAAAAGAIAMNEYAQTMDWNTAATAATFDALTVTITNDATTDSNTQRGFVVANVDDASSTGVTETIAAIENRDGGTETVTNGLLIQNTGASTMTNAIQILETAGVVTTAINIGNNVTTGISIGTGVTTGISIASGGITSTGEILSTNTGTGLSLRVNDVASDTTPFVVDADGNVGIGTAAPSRAMDVFQTAAAPQLRLSKDLTYYSEFTVDSVGDLQMAATGSDIRALSENLWICDNDACPALTLTGDGNIFVENVLKFGNGVYLKNDSATELSVYDNNDNAMLIFDEL